MPLPSLTASTSLRPAVVQESGLPNGETTGLFSAETFYAIAQWVTDGPVPGAVGCGKGSSIQKAMQRAEAHAQSTRVPGAILQNVPANKAQYTLCRRTTRGRDQDQALDELGF